MKKTLTPTFHGLFAESSNVDRTMDPANKPWDVGIEGKLILSDPI